MGTRHAVDTILVTQTLILLKKYIISY